MELTLSSSVETVLEQFVRTRQSSELLCRPLRREDYIVQSMPDVSPTRWHLAHVTWFFERFVLSYADPDYQSPSPDFEKLFNSYYQQIGKPFPRDKRGLLTRPTVEEVFRYRHEIESRVKQCLEHHAEQEIIEELLARVTLGIHHEQQHQELMLMDIKHVLFQNPLLPAYDRSIPQRRAPSQPNRWIPFEQTTAEFGHSGDTFAFDNESPRHQRLLQPFALASRPVTNGEYLEFIEDGGYKDPKYWLADGWTLVEQEQWFAPLYWFRQEADSPRPFHEYRLSGPAPLDLNAPVCHLSFYEAEAFAHWSGYRLPTEFEWEHASRSLPCRGNFVESGLLHPTAPTEQSDAPFGMFGDGWEWTRSSYDPYPGYRARPDALGEYNGKFMVNQYVLRGGACLTPGQHIRPTYRNFYYPHQRWMVSTLRLAKDLT